MKNIEINYMNGSGYEVLYPKTTTKNLIDFGEVLYTKEQVNGFIAGLSNQVGNLHFAYGTYTGQFKSNTIVLDKEATVTATDWITVTVGFQPVGVILSELNGKTGNGQPYAPYLDGESYGSDVVYPVGFAIPWTNYQYPVLQATTGGFQVRNVSNLRGTTSFKPNLTYLNYKYAYLAFG